MLSFKQYIVELHGKGSINAIGKHHNDLAMHTKTKRGSAAKEYHSLQRDRASRAKGIMTGRISGTFVKHNKEYSKEDRKKAHAAKARIKPSDYR
jgi:DNA-binding transcriptional regulator YhcF (GntR family)